jgi:protein-disulfide isomerase
MKKEMKIVIAILIAVVVTAFSATKLYQLNTASEHGAHLPKVERSTSSTADKEANDEPLKEKLVRYDSPAIGPTLAKVTIVEFLDPECESCKAFHPVVKRILKQYEGRVRFVVRYMGFHRSSAMAVAATEAAGLQGQYWQMQELLFDQADEWGHRAVPDEAFFIKYAEKLALNVEAFKKDLNDPKWAQKLNRDMDDGTALGVVGTPTIFINGSKLQELTYEAFEDELKLAFLAKNLD